MRNSRASSWMPGIPDGAKRLALSRLFLLADLAFILVLAVVWIGFDRGNVVLLLLILAAILLAYVELYRRESAWSAELADLNEGLRRALAESDTLAEISKEFSGEIQVEVLFDLVARRARELLGGDYASVAVMDEASGETVWVAGVGFKSKTFQTLRREPGKGLVGRALQSGEPVVVEGFGRNPDFPVAEFKYHKAEGMVSAVVMPMSRGAKPLGALTVGFRREHKFTDEELELLEALSAQAGIAMENATLYAQEQRRVAELQAVLDHMSEGVVVTTPAGKVMRCNQAAMELLGELSPGTDLNAEDWRRNLEIADANGEPLSVQDWPPMRAALGEQFAGREATVRRGEARRRHISVDGRPIVNKKGQVVLGVTVIHDVTAAREMDMLKDEFLSLAAHELKTPLTSIKGYAQMLLSSKGDTLGELRRRALMVMDQQADKINRMVEQFLLVEEIRSGRLLLQPDTINLGAAVSESCGRLSRMTSGYHLACEVAEDVFARADERGLDIVLSNLVENAMKYSPEGTTVSVTVTRGDGQAIVCVRDGGMGIPRDKQGYVFERFYQVDPGKGKGVGLGLYISQELIAIHGGRMWFESEEGVGSSFYFSLPLAEPRAEALRA